MDINHINNHSKRSFFYINQLINTAEPENLEKSDKIQKAIESAYKNSELEDKEYTIFNELEKRANEIASNEVKESNRLNKKIKKSLSHFDFEGKEKYREDFQLWNMNKDELKFPNKLIENTKAYRYNKICRHVLKKRNIKISSNQRNKQSLKSTPTLNKGIENINTILKYSLVNNLSNFK